MSWWTQDEESSGQGDKPLGSKKTLKEKILAQVNSNEVGMR
jgi:hypothetical protein